MIPTEPRQLALHALFQFTLEQMRDIRPEWLERRTKKTGPGAVSRQRTTLHEIHKRRRIAARTQQFIHHTTHRRSTADAGEVLGVISALALKSIVPTSAAHQRTQEYKLVRRSCHLRHELREVYSGQLGLDGGKFAAQTRGCFRLRINHIHLWRSAVEMDVNHSLVRRPTFCFRSQQIRQSKSAHTQRTRTKENPARNAVTMPIGLSEEFQHVSGN